MQILITRNGADIDRAFERLSSAEVLGCDTETSGLSAKTSKLHSVQFSDGDFSVLVPISEKIDLGKLAEILEDETIQKIFHNARFDLSFLKENGYSTKNVYDTMIAEKVLTKGADQSVSLAETLYRYFAVDLDKSQRKKFSGNWNGIWTRELVEYAMNDVVFLPKLMHEQVTWLESLDLRSEYKTSLEKITKLF